VNDEEVVIESHGSASDLDAAIILAQIAANLRLYEEEPEESESLDDAEVHDLVDAAEAPADVIPPAIILLDDDSADAVAVADEVLILTFKFMCIFVFMLL
jgi:hypothetical protein